MTVALGALMALPSGAFAAPAQDNKVESKPAAGKAETVSTEVKSEPKGDGAARQAGRLSMKGAAALGSGMAMRAGLNVTTAQDINNGVIGIDAGMLFSLAKELDIGFNLRIPMFNVGLSPGAAVRWAFIDDTRFHLALVGNLQVPMTFNGFALGLSVEPGVAMSYFVNENVELFTNLLFAYTPLFTNQWGLPGSGHAGFLGTLRNGLAYQVTNSNIGFFAGLDLSAGYEPVRRFIFIGDRGTGLAFNVGFSIGTQYRF